MQGDFGFDTLAVSACMLGCATAYDGASRLDIDLIKKIKGQIIVPVCPEQLSGMPTPRVPSEIQPGRESVMNKEGVDVTEFFTKGKILTLESMKYNNCIKAVLKNGSPSCGTSWIYDGSFQGIRIAGMGMTAEYLLSNGFEVSAG
ncbi:MAG: DUF523 domain-containing protein [Bacilli bacterium]|nr:DUF523 domain-containing protein [Bacilli bacterium]